MEACQNVEYKTEIMLNGNKYAKNALHKYPLQASDKRRVHGHTHCIIHFSE